MMALHIHKERLDDLSLLEVANDFVQDNDRRKTVFGQFDQSDFRKSSALLKSVGTQVDMSQ